MDRDVDKCRHCGRVFVRLDKTPIVNRSDGRTFHVSLFSGPELRPPTQDELHATQAMCHFKYIHDLIGPHWNSVVVLIAHANEGRRELLRQIGKAADKIAGLVQIGGDIGSIYTLESGLLMPGWPKGHSAPRFTDSVYADRSSRVLHVNRPSPISASSGRRNQ